MNDSEHRCPPHTTNGVPNSRFRITSWDVCFGGRVTGLTDDCTKDKFVSHIRFCPFCGQEAHTEASTND